MRPFRAGSIYGLVIGQLGSFTDETITNLEGQTQSIPDFLSDRFQFESYMKGE